MKMTSLATKLNKLKRKAGFSMVEVMAVVAILGILAALATPNLVNMKRSLDQKELDAKAETIYLAVQNEISKLRASGNEDIYFPTALEGVPTATKLTYYPLDMDPGNQKDLYFFNRNYSYLTQHLMEPGVVDASLTSNHWVIEYEPSGGYVYSVYYSEKKDDLEDDYRENPEAYDEYRKDSKTRIKNGALIGYYGGDVISASTSTTKLVPTISVNNGEILSADIQCTAPTGINDVEFLITLSDTQGHRYSWKAATDDINNLVHHVGIRYSYHFDIDDLSSSGKRFAAKYGGRATPLDPKDDLVPGTRLTIQVTAYSKNSGLVDQGNATAFTNSLFDYNIDFGETGAENPETAHIVCTRHLQNLDSSSGVTSSIKNVVLHSDINMRADDTPDGWYDTYGKSGVTIKSYFNGKGDNSRPYFKPIVNNNLIDFNGYGHAISGLFESTNDVQASQCLGLFESIGGGVSISRIRLEGAMLDGLTSGTTGALVGSVSGQNNTITNCWVYLDKTKDVANKTENDIWINGDTSGGLVGVVTTSGGVSKLDISDSFASSVISSTTDAGGLVGRAEAGSIVNINQSYSDSYMMGHNVAGLINGDASLIEGCYTAGFLKAKAKNSDRTSIAGLVNGTVGIISDSYTIVNPENITDSISPEIYSTCRSITDPSSEKSVYYFVTSGIHASGTHEIGPKKSAELLALIGDAFKTDTRYTVSYDLRGTLSNYPYPCLQNLPHYGDWQAEFKQGGIVYYEKYLTGEYGFSGANVPDTIETKGTVVGDGYGLVYRSTDTLPASISVTIGNQEPFTLATINYYPVVDDGVEYRIYPFPVAVVNSAPLSTSFYQKTVVELGPTHKDYYYFNPHFAKTYGTLEDTSADAPAEEKGKIYIRTPRQLHNLSEYYDDYYSDATLLAEYLQERDADFDRYDWSTFAGIDKIKEQKPIGRTEAKAFSAVFNGGCYRITNISFVTDGGDYVGFIGYNKGKIKNVVLTTDFDLKSSKHYYVQRKGAVQANDVLHLGVLSGYNKGEITNCAIAGYYLSGDRAGSSSADYKIYAYPNTTLYAGGLV
ncbi:MAG: type II secretion system GspH family protein, partial [Lachnospiraceae bacterium]|nr:type II secretion system GspH family protein [Lachnospiraceae bacterium]